MLSGFYPSTAAVRQLFPLCSRFGFGRRREIDTDGTECRDHVFGALLQQFGVFIGLELFLSLVF
jgi:hypothetical protein